MHTQPHLFGPTADVHAHQPELFPAEDRSRSERCACGEFLVTTETGYLCCPRGCGRLIDPNLLESKHERA